MSAYIIDTHRLQLIAATPSLLQAELADIAEFSAMLRITRPAEWPPNGGEYDDGAVRFFLAQLSTGGAQAAGWYTWYALTRVTEGEAAHLIGNGGYLGPPDEKGKVEIGYSVCEGWRGRGLGTEIIGGLVTYAWSYDFVKRIVARTRPDNSSSVAVLRANGFLEITSSDPEMLLFERLRTPPNCP